MIQPFYLWVYIWRNWKLCWDICTPPTKFLTALFTIANSWRQPKCPSTLFCRWPIYSVIGTPGDLVASRLFYLLSGWNHFSCVFNILEEYFSRQILRGRQQIHSEAIRSSVSPGDSEHAFVDSLSPASLGEIRMRSARNCSCNHLTILAWLSPRRLLPRNKVGGLLGCLTEAGIFLRWASPRLSGRGLCTAPPEVTFEHEWRRASHF